MSDHCSDQNFFANTGSPQNDGAAGRGASGDSSGEGLNHRNECARHALVLTAYFDGEAGAEEIRLAQLHLTACRSCALLWHDWTRTRFLLQVLPVPPLPATLLTRILLACRLSALPRKKKSDARRFDPLWCETPDAELAGYPLAPETDFVARWEVERDDDLADVSDEVLAMSLEEMMKMLPGFPNAQENPLEAFFPAPPVPSQLKDEILRRTIGTVPTATAPFMAANAPAPELEVPVVEVPIVEALVIEPPVFATAQPAMGTARRDATSGTGGKRSASKAISWPAMSLSSSRWAALAVPAVVLWMSFVASQNQSGPYGPMGAANALAPTVTTPETLTAGAGASSIIGRAERHVVKAAVHLAKAIVPGPAAVQPASAQPGAAQTAAGVPVARNAVPGAPHASEQPSEIESGRVIQASLNETEMQPKTLPEEAAAARHARIESVADRDASLATRPTTPAPATHPRFAMVSYTPQHHASLQNRGSLVSRAEVSRATTSLSLPGPRISLAAMPRLRSAVASQSDAPLVRVSQPTPSDGPSHADLNDAFNDVRDVGDDRPEALRAVVDDYRASVVDDGDDDSDDTSDS